jgi:hypothetical protein
MPYRLSAISQPAEFADNGFEKWRERLVLEGRLHQLVQHPQELLFAYRRLAKI